MTDILESHSRSKDERCSICYRILPSNEFFCSYCDSPEEPEVVPDSNLSLGQTFLRIVFLVILFIGFVLYKMDLSLDEITQEKPLSDGSIPAEEQSKDESFKMIHFVKVGMANVRDEPSFKGKIIIVLHSGEEVDIQERQAHWSKITAHEKSGWVSNKLLDSKIQ